MTRASRRGAVLAGIVAIACVAHTALWLAACSRLQDGFAEFVGNARTSGWVVTAGPPVRAGWPLAAGLDVPHLDVRGGDGLGGLAWTAPMAELRLALLHPATLAITIAGRQTLHMAAGPGMDADGIGIEARPFVASVPLDGGPPVLTASGLAIATPWGRLLSRNAVARLTGPTATLEAQGVALPDTGSWGAAEIVTLSATAVLTRPVPEAPSPAAQAEAWRRAGGTVEVSSVHLVRRALDVAAQGVLRLDAQLQPVFDGTVVVTGYRAGLEDLVQAGALPARSATTARAVLDLLAAPSGGGPVSLPIQIRDGLLVVARFPLLRLPGLVWAG